ncbi:MAG: hypothetical protein JRF05_05350, partial [Deltaproteobacteria bacterium]|nr:hypothetical protein [Deltaproteobacteria bacterium]
MICFFDAMDYLDLLPHADRQAIETLLQEKSQWLRQGKKGVERYRQSYEEVSHIRASRYDFSGDVVT